MISQKPFSLWLPMIFLIVFGFIVSSPIASFAASIDGNIGKIEFDRSAYPIPTELSNLIVTIQIFDQDFNTSPDGSDQIAQDVQGEPGVGPVKVSIVRGNEVVLGYAGGLSSNNGKIDSQPIASSPAEKSQIKQFGPIDEVSPSSGIFEFDVVIKNSDGPESSKCPVLTDAQRFDDATESARHCILEGDVLKVEYTDPTDSSGNSKVVTASSSFIVSNPVIQSGTNEEDVTVRGTYRIGQPLALVLFDSNLNLDTEKAETYSLDHIQFQSDKVKTTMGPVSGVQSEFDPKPAGLRETGENTGIFYTVIEIPRTLKGQTIQIGEVLEFEYTQRGFGASLVVVSGKNFDPSLYVPSFASTPPLPEVEQRLVTQFEQNMEMDNLKKFSPVMQLQMGISPQDVLCKESFEKIFKSYDGTPICVKSHTAEKLVERGWAYY